jgi:dynein light chain 1
MTTLAQALKNWEAANPETPVADAEYIKLYCQQPPINKLDNSISVCGNCERIALSTNNIDRMVTLTGMNKLKILSLGRNLIKKVEFLESGKLRILYIKCFVTTRNIFITSIYLNIIVQQ